MAKNSTGVDIQCRQIIKDVTDGHFSPVYLLMGDEPYYPELVCRAIQEHCIPEEDKAKILYKNAQKVLGL